jgi:hypothetical protein
MQALQPQASNAASGVAATIGAPGVDANAAEIAHLRAHNAQLLEDREFMSARSSSCSIPEVCRCSLCARILWQAMRFSQNVGKAQGGSTAKAGMGAGRAEEPVRGDSLFGTV